MRARAMLVDDHLADSKPRLRIGVRVRECTGTCAQSYMKVHLIPAIQALRSDNLTSVHIFLRLCWRVSWRTNVRVPGFCQLIYERSNSST